MDGGPVLEIGFSMAPISVSAPAPAEPARPAEAEAGLSGSRLRRPEPPAPERRAAEPASGFALLDIRARPAAQPPAAIPPGAVPSPADTLPALPEGRPLVRAEAAPPPGRPATRPTGLGWLDLSAGATPGARTRAAPTCSGARQRRPGPVPRAACRARGPGAGGSRSRPRAAAGERPARCATSISDLSAATAPARRPRHSLGAGDIGIEDNDLLYLGERGGRRRRPAVGPGVAGGDPRRSRRRTSSPTASSPTS